MIDVVIIGAGVSGCAVARELSRYEANIVVLEKNADVGEGTSKANSGIVHGGYDARENSLMAKLNLEGNSMMKQWSEELDFPFQQIGSLVLCFEEESLPELEQLKQRGERNGVKNLTILTGQEARAMEPNLSEDVVAALYCPSAGIVCPFQLNIAMAENAAQNGVEFYFHHGVEHIEKRGDGYVISTNGKEIEAKVVINAAGVYADRLHNMVSQSKLHIIPRRGTYMLMDKRTKGYIHHTIFQLPTKRGKGILATPTVDGNLLIGPTSVDIEDAADTATVPDELKKVKEEVQRSIKGIPFHQTITSFAGIRAHEQRHEFIIEEVDDAPGFFDVAGIESPGLTASPAIGKTVAEMVQNKLKLKEKSNFNPIRKGIALTREMTLEEHQKKIQENPSYGKMICRCEKVTEGEIIDAIHRPLGATTLDGIKRRTRAMAGRCQGGFCLPRVMEILARELNAKEEEMVKNSADSSWIVGQTKEEQEYERI